MPPTSASSGSAATPAPPIKLARSTTRRRISRLVAISGSSGVPPSVAAGCVLDPPGGGAERFGAGAGFLADPSACWAGLPGWPGAECGLGGRGGAPARFDGDGAPGRGASGLALRGGVVVSVDLGAAPVSGRLGAEAADAEGASEAGASEAGASGSVPAGDSVSTAVSIAPPMLPLH